MFVRQCIRRHNGKRQAYWALVESYRTARGPRQRIVAWLGKQDEAGRLGMLEAAEAAATPRSATNVGQLSLFEDETPPEPRWVEVNTSGVRVENTRQFGGPWLALKLIQQLQLEEFLKRTMPAGK